MEKIRITAILLCVVMLTASLSACKPKAEVDPIDDNYRVFYQIFVGSFSDSNGDGIGDLRGIINRMDYLNDGNINSGKSLGVQGLWLSPIFLSPSYHKYDVQDYYQIDPYFGTEADLKELIELCHKRNVKVIIDLPINHTSNKNVWFQKFLEAVKQGDIDDPYYYYYTSVTAKEKKTGISYQPISSSNRCFECNFSSDMPELNFDDTNVFNEVVNIAKHYLDLGLDGFRFDAVKYIYFGDNLKSIAFWKKYMKELRAIKPDIYVVGEDWSGDTEILEYTEALNCFNFGTSGSDGIISQAAKNGNLTSYTKYVASYQNRMKLKNADAMFMPFISNHDMDRSAGYLFVSQHQAHMAANLLILCTGSPFIYYGEEIGLRGSRGSEQTDANRRLAMLWDDGDTVKNPVGTTYDPTKQINGTVASQKDNPNSLYNYYCRLIAIRNKYPAIARGDYRSLEFSNKSFGGFLVEYAGEQLGIFHNVSGEEVTIDISSGLYSFSEVLDYIGQGKATLKGTMLTLGPQTSVIVK